MAESPGIAQPRAQELSQCCFAIFGISEESFMALSKRSGVFHLAPVQPALSLPWPFFCRQKSSTFSPKPDRLSCNT